jgi:sirohydrochlorin ferrochelatase
MQQPSLAEALADAAESDFQRIVIQPHLLFSGELHEQVRCAVEKQIAASRGPGAFFRLRSSAGDSQFIVGWVEKASRLFRFDVGPRQWIVTAPLGPEPELAAAVVNVVEQNRHARQEVT